VREHEGIRFARPMLCVGSAQIVEYLNGRGLSWRVDRTNRDIEFKRNFIRHKMIPQLEKECGGSVVDGLEELSSKARGFYKSIGAAAEGVFSKAVDFDGDKVELEFEFLSGQHREVEVELVRRCLGLIGCGERNLRQEHFERVLELGSEGASGKRVELPGGFEVLFEYGKLVFSRSQAESGSLDESVVLKVPGEVEFGGYVVKARVLDAGECDIEKFKGQKGTDVEWFDLDKVKGQVVVRGRGEGDRFVPIGMDEEKKVGKFLTDTRVSNSGRRGVFIVEDGEKIIWVGPVRVSELVKISDETRKVLEIAVFGV